MVAVTGSKHGTGFYVQYRSRVTLRLARVTRQFMREYLASAVIYVQLCIRVKRA